MTHRNRPGRFLLPGLALLAALGVGLPVGADEEPARREAGLRTGSVAGSVALDLQPPRRTARRYARGTPPARAVQSIPVVVWVKGSAGNARPPSTPPVVTQRDTAFVPAAIVVPVGTTVRFPNGDDFFHNVFSYSGPARFDLGRYPRGDSKDVTFDEPGVVKIYCEVHEFMRAAVVVSENPWYALVADDGSYRIDGIPAGRHTLVFWHADLGEVERTVDVTDGGVTRLDVELG